MEELLGRRALSIIILALRPDCAAPVPGDDRREDWSCLRFRSGPAMWLWRYKVLSLPPTLCLLRVQKGNRVCDLDSEEIIQSLQCHDLLSTSGASIPGM